MKKMTKTQEEILDAAKYIYQKIGYRGSTFQMLVDRSGISRSLINYYFPKKQDVLVTFLGNHLDKITEYVTEQYCGDSIMIYMLSTTLYNQSMIKDERTHNFQMDVLFRTDKENGPYKNYDLLYKNIVLEYNVDITEDELYLKEIAIFGANAELLLTYLRTSFEISFKTCVEQTIINTLLLLKIPYFIINTKLNEFWKEYDKITSQDIEFNLFD